MSESRPSPTRTDRIRRRLIVISLGIFVAAVNPGCHTIPIAGHLHTDSTVAAGVQGTIEVKTPVGHDPGPVVPVVLRAGAAGAHSPRIAMIDVDGLLLNQNFTGLYSAGENPVASFHEKLEAAARDPRVVGVVLRIHSPGGGVAASDLMAEELRKFREVTRKPCVASILDLGTGGAYYLAIGCDMVVALPTSIVGGIGAIFNHANLQDAVGYLNVQNDTIKSAQLIDMGTVSKPLDDSTRALFQEIADGFGERYVSRVKTLRPAITADDLNVAKDGRIVSAAKAMELHLIDMLGYPDDAIGAAARLARAEAPEVIIFQRRGYPTRSIYATAPNVPITGDLVPYSFPGLERSKLPTFLYLWQPDPTLTRQSGR